MPKKSLALKPSSNARSRIQCDPSASSTPWHTLSVAAAFDRQNSDPTRGLSQAEAARRLALYGDNALAQGRRRSSWAIFIAQFRSLIIGLLVAATVIAFATGENIDAIAILVVIVLNTSIGFFTEWKAERALSALRKESAPVAHLIREGDERVVPATELTPGDLVVLAAGSRTPADGRIVECVRLQIEEGALTGESIAVDKTIESLEDKDASLGDMRNMAFLGTTIMNGRGRLLVTATGARTEVGKIGTLIEESTHGASPLEQKLDRLGRLLVVFVTALCGVIVMAGWIRGVANFWQMLEIGLSLAIAAVPEGLPAVATMTLALGMQRMARMRALVRRLPAVETLGSTTVICTDKTGTLTKNEMTVCVFALDHRRIDVTGEGYAPAGDFKDGDTAIEPQSDACLGLAIRIGALCNDARVERAGDDLTVLGDPTEAALMVAAEKAGMSRKSLAVDFPRLGETPFDSETKRMVTLHGTPQGHTVACVKGSPGTLLGASKKQFRATGATPLTSEDRERWEKTNRALAGAALRVLGLAFCELPHGCNELEADSELTFVGLVGMIDPLRHEAGKAIAICRSAGIRTVMITGDQPPTAAEIARQLGIDRDPYGRPLRTVHGRELKGLDAAGWSQAVSDAAVFARVTPEQKLQIVEALQRQGHVVAMTGDGVNDAPAMKKADIGIAMGIKGVEVAKENADLVITDDNFASIVNAVEQGRIIYGNIQRFLHYLLSCNISEILTVFVALMLGWPMPLVPLQILWLNLITDVFPAFALALEPSTPDVMTRPPRNPKESLLNARFIGLIVWQGLLLTCFALIAFGVGIHWHGTEGAGLQEASTMAFMTLAVGQILHAFNSRSQWRSALTRRLFKNGWLWAAVVSCLVLQSAAVYAPFLQHVLHTTAPTAWDWGVIVACSLLPVLVVEIVKWIRSRWSDNKSTDAARIHWVNGP